ncbi:MAG: hypothetical protein ACLGSH_08425 [Acidobacteriota bacterium]
MLRSSGQAPNTLLLLTIPEPLPLTTRSEILYLTFQQSFQIEKKALLNRFKVCTREYIYGLEDESNQEILQFHWHPETTPDVLFPHLHIKAGAGRSIRSEILKAHFRTDRIAFEEFALLLINGFGVIPDRKDAPEVLSSNLKRFVDHRSWHYYSG